MPLSAQDIYLAGRDRLLATTSKYTPEAIDKEGNDINMILRLVAGVGEELSLEASRQDLARSLSTAASVSDEAVDRVVSDMTGGKIQRFRQNAAVVDIRFSRVSTYALTLPAGATASTVDGISFRTIDEVTWPTGNNSAKLVRAVAENTGRSGNVDSLTITKPSGDLGDKSISCTNPTPASGGREAETNSELITRARGWFENSPRATLSAIRYGALQTIGVVQATVRELTTVDVLRDIHGIVFNRVSLTVADASGQCGTALAAQVRENLQEWRGAGVPVLLVGGTLLYKQVQFKGLVVKQGYSQASVFSELAAKIVSAGKEIEPETTLERALLIGIAKFQVDGIASVPDDSLVVPATDQEPPPGYTIRIRPEDVSFV